MWRASAASASKLHSIHSGTPAGFESEVKRKSLRCVSCRRFLQSLLRVSFVSVSKARQRKVGTSQHRQEMRMPNQAQEPVTTVTCSDLLLCNSQDRGQILFPSSRENMKVPYELTVRRKLSKTAYSLEDASFS